MFSLCSWDPSALAWLKIAVQFRPSARSVYRQGGASLCNWHTSICPPAFSLTAASLADCTFHFPCTGSLLVGHTSFTISNVVQIKFDPDSPPLSFPFSCSPPLALSDPHTRTHAHTYACKGILMYSTCGYEGIWIDLFLLCVWLLHGSRGM